ncbi:DHA2 family efflux MFS transporter permease subunit [Cellulomonas sp. IC4_254]|uniref:DHA2 family efflux MFS transporter permease subunit n=1 Tax=Cellulomonas sp. IC4_254 TaxID=2714040 RepID=UPI00141DC53A|nr:DHA2 family efflux MFS transporter permease subunit [Cellulomonas sp. IC4_254]NHT17381.1 DHA2 family efflux MFS transporter permease subunit [Cellulomonas sp. IC4_254]
MSTQTPTTAPGGPVAGSPGDPRAAAAPGATPSAAPLAAPGGPAIGGTAGRSTTHAVPVAVALLAASLPMFMATLDNLVVTSALPVLQAELGATLTDLQWVVNAYTLAFATLMIAAATVGDRWGRRRTFLGGIAVFTLGSIAAALAGSPGALIAARAVQGVGAAAVMPLSLTLLAAAVPASRRAMAIGVWGGVSGLGVALGPVVGGAVVEGISWQAMFWINVPVALVAVPLVLRALPEGRGRAQRLDLLGLVLAAAGVLGIVWGVVHGNEDGWTSAGVLGPVVGGVVALALFLRHESRTPHALVPLRLFRSRSFSVANVSGFAFSLGAFGAVFLLAQYLQVVQGYSPLEAGLRTLPWTAAPMVVAPIAGVLAPRVGVRVLLTGGLVAQAAGLAWLGFAVADGGYAALVPGLVLAGIGMGLTFAPSATAVLSGMAPDDHGTASSTNSTLREVGVALGVAVLTAVFTAAGGTISPDGFDAGLRPAVLTGAAVLTLAAVASLAMPRATGRAEA